MQSEKSSPATHTPVERALMKAALHVASTSPTFVDQIDWRLNRAKRSVQFLASYFSEAAFHQLDIPAEGLYGVAELIGNELETVQILVELRDAGER